MKHDLEAERSRLQVQLDEAERIVEGQLFPGPADEHVEQLRDQIARLDAQIRGVGEANPGGSAAKSVGSPAYSAGSGAYGVGS